MPAVRRTLPRPVQASHRTRGEVATAHPSTAPDPTSIFVRRESRTTSARAQRGHQIGWETDGSLAALAALAAHGVQRWRWRRTKRQLATSSPHRASLDQSARVSQVTAAASGCQEACTPGRLHPWVRARAVVDSDTCRTAGLRTTPLQQQMQQQRSQRRQRD